MRSETDSRAYIIPFSISCEADAPSDFMLPPQIPAEFDGIFLPQDRASFAQRSFPPCVIIIAAETIWILRRRSAEHTVIPLARFEALECGRILLLGWLGLQWDGGSLMLRYNRRSAPTVERFLSSLKASWLTSAFTAPNEPPQTFGPEPDLKFRNAASTELAAGEIPLLQFFQPPVCRIERHFGLRRESRKAGDLLMLTDRRLLWITDRRRSAQEEYGTVARSTPLHALKQVRANQSESGLTIDSGFGSGTLWSVPVFDDGRHAALAFVEMAARREAGETGPTCAH